MRANVLMNLGVLVVVVPIAFFVGWSLTGSDFDSYAVGALILMMVVLGVLVLGSSKRFIIEPNQIEALGPFGMGGKKMPIDGVSDLVLDGKKLKRRSDGKVVARISAFDNADDRSALTAAIPAA